MMKQFVSMGEYISRLCLSSSKLAVLPTWLRIHSSTPYEWIIAGVFTDGAQTAQQKVNGQAGCHGARDLSNSGRFS